MGHHRGLRRYCLCLPAEQARCRCPVRCSAKWRPSTHQLVRSEYPAPAFRLPVFFSYVDVNVDLIAGSRHRLVVERDLGENPDDPAEPWTAGSCFGRTRTPSSWRNSRRITSSRVWALPDTLMRRQRKRRPGSTTKLNATVRFSRSARHGVNRTRKRSPRGRGESLIALALSASLVLENVSPGCTRSSGRNSPFGKQQSPLMPMDGNGVPPLGDVNRRNEDPSCPATTTWVDRR